MPAPAPWQAARAGCAAIPVVACSLAPWLCSRALSRAMLESCARMRPRSIKQSVRARPAGSASQLPCAAAGLAKTCAFKARPSTRHERHRKCGRVCSIASSWVSRSVAKTVLAALSTKTLTDPSCSRAFGSSWHAGGGPSPPGKCAEAAPRIASAGVSALSRATPVGLAASRPRVSSLRRPSARHEEE